jgi:7-keto-8-aminopelargonate synthetase-like enzyme
MLFVWVPLVFSSISFLFLFNSDVFNMLTRIYNNRDFLRKAYGINKSSVNLNHTFLLIQKLTNNSPIKEGEMLWETYRDCRKACLEKDKWPYLMKLDNTINSELDVQMENDQNSESQKCLNFSSYSYLNGIRDESLRSFVFEEMKDGGYHFGNHGPRMLGGNNKWLCKLETKLASFLNREKALCFSSGFLACKSAIQAVSSPKDIIFADGKVHESLRDGIRVAKSRGTYVKYFRHNDFDHLYSLLKKHRQTGQNAYIIIESVYSMDGDFTNLPLVKKYADEYECRIILDEAHGIGTLGETGRGIEELQNCVGAAWMIVGSLTKSLSSVGGFIACDTIMYDFCHFFATGTMFSAPMSVPNAIMAYKMIDVIEMNPQWVQETRDTMQLLKTYLLPLQKKHGATIQSDPGSPLVAFILKDFSIDRVLSLSVIMKRKGFYVATVCAPACEIRAPRLRLTAPRGMTEQNIKDFVRHLDETLTETIHFEQENIMKEIGDLLPLIGL